MIYSVEIDAAQGADHSGTIGQPALKPLLDFLPFLKIAKTK